MSQFVQEKSEQTLRREFALVKVDAHGELQDRALGVVGAWSGRLLELSSEHFTAEITADPERISSFIEALGPFGLSASFRTGSVSLS